MSATGTASTRPTDATYTMGRTQAETARLIKQSRLYNRSTRRVFEDAGITAGMKVLDVGSGAGDVALLAADLVGPTGSVVGLDVNGAILQTARQRATEAGLTNVCFVEGDVRDVALPDEFDAVVGRLVLMYTADPAETVRAAAGHVRPGGIVAFQEIDFTLVCAHAAAGYLPPLRASLWDQGIEVFRQSGAHVSMGLELHRAFTAAGLGAPEMSLHAPLGAAADWPGYDYVAQSFRSFLPLLEKYGIITAAELDVDTLADRLCAETVATGNPWVLPPYIGAWARKP